MESSVTMRAVCSSPFVRRRLGLDRLCRGTTRRDRWQGDLEESGFKTGKHTATSLFWQGMHHRKTDPRSARSTSGIKSQRQWQSFQDAHPSSLEETSMSTLFQTAQRSDGTISARSSRTLERTSARFAGPRSSGVRRRGLRDRCHRILAGKEILGKDTMGSKADLITFCFQ